MLTGTATSRDTDDFASLYEETFDAVYRYALVLSGDPDEAEDISAEVYLRAWCKRHAYRGDGPVLSWLLSIAHNYTVTTRRKASRETVDSDAVLAHAGDAVVPEPAALTAIDRSAVLSLLRELTPEQREVIVRRFFCEWTHAEIAKHTRRMEAAVRALQYRALRHLRTLLESGHA